MGSLKIRPTSFPQRTPPRHRRVASGITMVEVVVTITIFALFVSAYAVTFPPVIRSTAHAANNLKASELARHKIEQVRQLGYTKLTRTDLAAGAVIDATQANANGPYTFATVDSLVNNGAKVGYFGPSTNATGTLTVGAASVGSSSPAETVARQVTVTISWQGGGAMSGTYTTQTVIVAP